MVNHMQAGLIINSISEMEGIPFGLKYFDDDTNVYVSPSIFKEIAEGRQQLRYVVMSWRTSQITIQAAVKDIIERIEQYGKETGQIP